MHSFVPVAGILGQDRDDRIGTGRLLLLRRETVGEEKQMNTDRLTMEAEHRQFFYAAGKAIWYAQFLEDAICTFVTMVRHLDSKISREDAYAYLDATRKRTLGQIRKQAEDLNIVPANLRERHLDFVDERNWLIHRAVNENLEDLLDSGRRPRLIARVERIEIEAKLLTKEMSKALFDLGKGIGWSDEAAEEMAREKIDEMLKGQHSARG